MLLNPRQRKSTGTISLNSQMAQQQMQIPNHWITTKCENQQDYQELTDNFAQLQTMSEQIEKCTILLQSEINLLGLMEARYSNLHRTQAWFLGIKKVLHFFSHNTNIHCERLITFLTEILPLVSPFTLCFKISKRKFHFRLLTFLIIITHISEL